MKIKRIEHASGRKKTVCTGNVLAFFGIGQDQYRYCQNRNDMERILRSKGFSVRNRRNAIGYARTVGQVREKIKKLDEDGYYYVSVPGHAMLLGSKGQTVVDTAPRLRDRRRVLAISRIA